MKLIARPFYFFFFIAFTFFGFHVNGQTKVEQHNQNGLITTIFNTPLGNVTVYLPEHSTNESISGTIKVRPTGTNENKKAKHKIELQSYHLEYANTSIPLTKEHFFISASNSTKNNGLGLVDKKGKVVLNSVISQKTTEELQSPSFNYIPEYMVSGEAAKITSRFDGNSTNSSVKLNSKDLEILAESKSGMFFRVPSNVSGTSQLQFEEGSHVAESSVNVLNTDLSVGRTNLKRGETTTLSIKVSGLEGLQTDVPITITNKSPSNISLEGGNTQQIVINPLTDASSG
ncbi:MAG TPA: hypothetical protein VJ945_07970, partial [Flavobacteriaceae bacterium]|nr:hypothetical protein [Flavobacteriaceae bacterium]